MKFACPHCQQVFSADESKSGSICDCPNCQKAFQLPEKQTHIKHIVANRPMESKRIAAALLAIFLGCFGIHKFYLGYTRAGLIHILLLFCSCGFIKILGWIEGIIYLTKSEDEFIRTYQIGQKEWL